MCWQLNRHVYCSQYKVTIYIQKTNYLIIELLK